jgi:hypothetical protein
MQLKKTSGNHLNNTTTKPTQMENNKQQTQFQLIDVKVKNGITFTVLVDDKKMVQQHFDIKTIEKIYGGGNNE